MKLCYRGIRYDYDATGRTPNASAAPIQPYALSYRGIGYTVGPMAAAPTAAVSGLNLCYRGLLYTLTGGTRETIGRAADLRRSHRPSDTMDPASVHRASLYRSLERRLRAAEARGDQALVQMLQQERRHIA
jgi:hypothetical protein